MKSVWILAAFAIAMALVSSPSAVSQPGPFVIEISKTIESGAYAVHVDGTVTVDPMNRTLAGTLAITVTNATGAELVSLSLEFANAMASGEVTTQRVPIPAFGFIIVISVDAGAATVNVSLEVAQGNADRRHD